MKKLALPVAAFSVLLAGAASAADIRMPVKAPPPVPVAVFSWTGCYVGAGGGYGMFDQRQNYRDFQGFLGQQAWDNGGSGWFGTVQVGCDYQVSPSIVVGAFADYDWSGIKGVHSNPYLADVFADEKHKSSWAAGGRIGWIPWQQTPVLVFLSGGYTEARFGQATYRSPGFAINAVLPQHTYSGWFLGAGYEYALGWLPGLFWKTEYRFADYGTETLALLTQAGQPRADFVLAHKYIQTIRSELVWRFNWNGAAVAAADVRRPFPVKAAAAAPVAAYNWTGCFVGAGGGYGMFDQRAQVFNPDPLPEPWNNGGRGWFGTAQVGCDYQASSTIVAGAFADYDWSGIKGKPTNPLNNEMATDEKLKSAWAAGGRIGWLPFQQPFLVYAAAGYTEARFGQTDFLERNGQPRDAALARHTYSGWFLATGYEYGIGWLPGLFWKSEYRYADFGKERVAILDLVDGGSQGEFEMRKRVQTVRSELVWRFNFAGPVVARY